MQKKHTGRRFIVITAIITAISLAVRLLYLFQYSGSPLFSCPLGPDVQEYHARAMEILAGRILWSAGDIHAPLYPYFLAFLYWISGFNFFVVRLLQILIGMLPAFLLFFTLRGLFAGSTDFKRFIPNLFLWIYLLYPPLIYYHGELISETLLLPLLCLSVFFLYRADDFYPAKGKAWNILNTGLAGFFAGLAVITHPLCLLFPVFESFYLLFRAVSGKRAGGGYFRFLIMLLFVFSAALPVVPVSAYNSYISSAFCLVQRNSGFNFFLGNNPDADGSCYLRPGPEWDKVYNQAEKVSRDTGLSKDKYFFYKAADFIFKDPAKYISLLARKALYSFNFRELPSGSDVWPLRFFTPFQRYSSWSFGLIAFFALAGLLKGLGRADFVTGLRHFLILGFSSFAAMVLTVTSARYRLPLLPSLFVFASYMICALPSCFSDRKKAFESSAAFLCSAIIIFLPVRLMDYERQRAEADTVIGEALMKEGRLNEAETHLTAASKVLDNWSRSFNLLGNLYSKKKDFIKAESMYRRALKVNPESYFAFMNLGILSSEKGETNEAEKYFAKAISLKPDSPEILYNTARFEMKRGKLARAEKLLKKCLRLSPADRKALNALGVLYIRSGRPVEAISFLKRALRLEPGKLRIRIMVNLAAACFDAGRSREALEIISDVLKKDPRDPEALELKKMVEEKKGS